MLVSLSELGAFLLVRLIIFLLTLDVAIPHNVTMVANDRGWLLAD